MGGHLPPVACIPQKRIAAREDASVAHEKAALAGAAELEARVAAFDSKEKKALRVSMLVLWRSAAFDASDAALWQHPALQEGSSLFVNLPLPLVRPAAWTGCNLLACLPRMQELAERESALAGKESKLAAAQTDLAERGAALESAKARLESDRRALEQREEALAAAQAEVRSVPRMPSCMGALLCLLSRVLLPYLHCSFVCADSICLRVFFTLATFLLRWFSFPAGAQGAHEPGAGPGGAGGPAEAAGAPRGACVRPGGAGDSLAAQTGATPACVGLGHVRGC